MRGYKSTKMDDKKISVSHASEIGLANDKFEKAIESLAITYEESFLKRLKLLPHYIISEDKASFNYYTDMPEVTMTEFVSKLPIEFSIAIGGSSSEYPVLFVKITDVGAKSLTLTVSFIEPTNSGINGILFASFVECYRVEKDSNGGYGIDFDFDNIGPVLDVVKGTQKDIVDTKSLMFFRKANEGHDSLLVHSVMYTLATMKHFYEPSKKSTTTTKVEKVI